MMTGKFLTCVLGVACCIGCSSKLQTFRWLEGSWEMQHPRGGTRLEVWENNDAKALSGKGLKVLNGDTTVLEAIELYYQDKHFWYVPTVPDQNNQQAIPFKLVSSENNKYTFENPAHDFPQRIIYNLKPFPPENTLSAPGDTLDVSVTSLDGEGIHFRFFRK